MEAWKIVVINSNYSTLSLMDFNALSINISLLLIVYEV
jgi:hypothetical protein